MFENVTLSFLWDFELVVIIPTVVVVKTLKIPSPDNPRIICDSMTLAARWLNFSLELSFFWENTK